MKIASVLLRWYKSFNVNYMNYPDRRSGVAHRPWNRLVHSSADDERFSIHRDSPGRRHYHGCWGKRKR